MNNERQKVLVRGLVRPGDVAADNSVLSTAMSDLEIELKGKGVISDANRPPNFLVRWLMKLVNF
jgi:flagellar L-ring protein precursor FlgH